MLFLNVKLYYDGEQSAIFYINPVVYQNLLGNETFT